MIVGQLEIQMMASLARLQKDMGDAKGMVGTAMRDIERSVNMAKAALGALGVGVSVGAFMALVKSANDATASMKDFGQEAGTTAAAISRFEVPARMAGLSTDAVAGAIFKMSKAAMEARDPMSNAGQALKAIGISTSELKGMKPDEMFERVARQIDKYGDGLTKNNVMQELFGKSGREMSRVVKEIAETAQLHATVTNEEAEAADRLQDQMVGLKMESEKFWRSLAGDGVPAMSAILKAFVDGKREAGLYEGAVRALTELFDQINGTGPAAELKRVQGALDAARQSAEMLRDTPWWATFGKGSLEGEAAKIADLEKRRDELRKQLHALELEEQNRRATAGVKPNLLFDPEATRKAVQAMKELALADQHVVQYSKMVAEVEQSTAKALADGAEERRKYIGTIEQEIERQKWANETMGMTREQIALLVVARLDEKMAILQASGAMETDLAQLQEEIDLRRKLAAEIGSGESNALAIAAANDALRDQVSIWSEAGNALGGFVNAMTSGFKSGVDYVKNLLKQLLAQMISVFAQRWVLSLGASLTSGGTSAALSSAGSAVGNGTLASGVLGFGSSVVAGYQGASLAAGLAGPTTAGASLFSGQGIGAALAGMGPVGWAALAVAAVAAVAMAFRDKGENWQGQLGFGSNANAYTTEGVFGREGFNFIQGQDATNRAIQDFMAGRAALDAQLAGHLTPEQVARITGNLGGAYSTRNDGQPSTFAFDRNDTTAAQQLTLEYLQKKYGTIFDEIDGTFAKFIRDYKGNAEDLLKEIGAFAALMDQLSTLGIKGMDVAALRAMARDGEEIGDTLQRVGGQWAWFTENFTSDAERLAIAQADVTAFQRDLAALGMTVPTTAAGWRDLALSLDVSTEAGRLLFDRLMAMGPAILSVADAMATATAAFNQTAGGLNPAYGSGIARANLESAVNAWRGAGGGNAGFTVDETIAAIGPLINNASSLTAALAYAQSLGPQAVQQLNNMISAYGAWQQSLDTGASTVGGLAGSAANAGGAVDDFASRLMDANRGLLDWINKTMLNPALSPLSPEQQFLEAQKQYQSVLASARGGDLVARGNLDEAAQTALEFARQRWGSNADYTAFYRTIIAEVGGVAGMTTADINAKLFGALPANGTLMTEQTGTAIVGGLQQLLALIAGGINVSDPRVAAATEEVATNLKSATNTGALA